MTNAERCRRYIGRLRMVKALPRNDRGGVTLYQQEIDELDHCLTALTELLDARGISKKVGTIRVSNRYTEYAP